jgi:hypothetical protein
MGESYSINIDIDDVSFVDIDKAQIENISNKLEDNIREILNTRITYGVGNIKIVFNSSI